MIDFNEISAISKTWNYRKTEDRNGTEDSFTIPEYSEKLKLKKIGGKSVVWNQLVNEGAVLTVTGRKYLSKSADVFSIINGAQSVSADKLIDLTKLFGAGKEPTTTTDPRITAIKKYLETHPEYNEGEIIDSLVDEIEVKDLDEETTSLLTTNFPSLKSAGNVYDYIDFNSAVKLPNGNYSVNVVRNVGSVDLGSLNWEYQGDSVSRFRTNAPYTCYWSRDLTTKNNLLTKLDYTITNGDNTNSNYNPTGNKLIATGGAYSNFIYVKDLSYVDTQTFTTAMEGQILYYELATPTTETITISGELLEWLKVEYGGNMYYKQDGLSLPIPNTTSIHKHVEKTEELAQIVIDDEVVWSAPVSMFNLYDDIIIDDDETSVNEDEVIDNE